MAVIQAKNLYSLRDSFEKCILINIDMQKCELVQKEKKKKGKKKVDFIFRHI